MLSLSHLRDEVLMFRRAMCDRRNSLTAIDNALGSLFYCICNIDPVVREQGDLLWHSTSAEWLRRKELMLLAGHPIGEEYDKPVFGEAMPC